MDFKIFESIEQCSEHRSEWNELASQVSHDIALTFEWNWALWKSHIKEENVQVVWITEGKKTIGIVPFYSYKRRIRGLPLTCLAPLSQLYSNHDSLILLDDSLDMLIKLLNYLKSEGFHWHVFTCFLTQQTHLYEQCLEKSKISGFQLEIVRGNSSPYLALEDSADDFLAKKKSKFRNDIRTRTRRLEQLGDLKLLKFEDKDQLQRAMKYLKFIERQSWKESSGSSITARSWEEEFYTTYAPLAAEGGFLRIYVLVFDNKPIAYDFGILYKNRYFLLKTSYVLPLRKYCPGVVLRWKVIQDLYLHHVQEHDFLGDAESWKLSWSRSLRDHASVFLYNKDVYSRTVHVLGELKRRIRIS